MTVNGTNFVSGSTVNFSGNALATTFVSATQLTAVILASDIATAGSFNVTVTNPGGGTSNAVSFTIVTPQDATQTIINSVNALFSQGVLICLTMVLPSSGDVYRLLRGHYAPFLAFTD